MFCFSIGSNKIFLFRISEGTPRIYFSILLGLEKMFLSSANNPVVRVLCCPSLSGPSVLPCAALYRTARRMSGFETRKVQRKLPWNYLQQRMRAQFKDILRKRERFAVARTKGHWFPTAHPERRTSLVSVINRRKPSYEPVVNLRFCSSIGFPVMSRIKRVYKDKKASANCKQQQTKSARTQAEKLVINCR